MTNTDKQKRLEELQAQVNNYTGEVPTGLLLSIERLKQELGISDTCDLDDGCINCGS